MQNLLWLFLAHYLADFPLQGEFLGIYKSKYYYLLFVHCFIWAGVVSLGLSLLGLFAWWKVIFLFSGHLWVDHWKCRHPERETKGLTTLLWIDQFAHALQILIVWAF